MLNSVYLLTVLLIILVIEQHAQGHSSGARAHLDPTPEFHVTGTDFLNTQTNKLCLLARLNASVIISHRIPGHHDDRQSHEIIIPDTASNEGSVCDFDYKSTLNLTFNGIKIAMLFQRDQEVKETVDQRVYCAGCDNGNWWLQTINVTIDNVSTIDHVSSSFPPTTLNLTADSESLPSKAMGLRKGVQLQRSYRCSKMLATPLEVIGALDLISGHSHISEWNASFVFYSIEVQPFLVIDNIFKDPLLCKDVTVFHAFIITIPIIYFVIFILVYHLKDTYGCPPNCQQEDKRSPNMNKAQWFSLSSSSKKYPLTPSSTPPVFLTTPDQAESFVLS